MLAPHDQNSLVHMIFFSLYSIFITIFSNQLHSYIRKGFSNFCFTLRDAYRKKRKKFQTFFKKQTYPTLPSTFLTIFNFDKLLRNLPPLPPWIWTNLCVQGTVVLSILDSSLATLSKRLHTKQFSKSGKNDLLVKS